MTIVYTSETGFTAQYAAMLGKSTKMTVLPLTEALTTLEKGTPIFYMGWLMAGKIKGFKKAKKKFKIVGTCAVGIRPDVKNLTQVLSKSYKMHDGELFYLPGGHAPDKLEGGKKKALKMVLSILSKTIQNQKSLSPTDERLLKVFEHGGSLVDKKLLPPIVQFLRRQQALEGKA